LFRTGKKWDEMGDELLIGSYKATLDKAGRLKIPERFRVLIEEKYGPKLFITSLENESVRIFPLSIWKEMTGTSEQSMAYIRSSYREFFLRAHGRGCAGEVDAKGRVLISPRLREKNGLQAEVEVVGMNNHLEVWDKDRLEAKLDQNPLSAEDFEKFAALGTVRKPE
jgi:MraZ protein